MITNSTRDNSENITLHDAVIRNDFQSVQTLVNNKVDINKPNENGETPLHYAVEYARVEIVQFLVKNGADVNAKNMQRYERTPLFSIRSLYWKEYPQNEPDSLSNITKIVQCLVNNGADINIQDNRKHTLIYMATKYGNYQILQLFVNNGADINIQCRDSIYDDWETLVHVASKEGSRDKIIFLIKNVVNKEAKNQKGQTPLHVAAQASQLDIVKLLIEEYRVNTSETDHQHKTPLQIAAENGHLKIVKFLIEYDSSIKKKGDWQGRTLHVAVDKNYFDIIEFLVKEGAYINRIDKNAYPQRETPLHIATNNNNLEMVKFLLENGADANKTNTSGETPLQIAAMEGYIEIIECLVKYGADINKKQGSEGYETTVLHKVVRYGHLFDTVKCLVKNGANVNEKDYNLQTPLHIATENGEFGTLETVEFLIAEGANINETDQWLKTPISIAAAKNYHSIAELLVEKKADLNIENSAGQTPLILALRYKNWDMVMFLMAKGAKGQISDFQSQFEKTPLVHLNLLPCIQSPQQNLSLAIETKTIMRNQIILNRIYRLRRMLDRILEKLDKQNIEIDFANREKINFLLLHEDNISNNNNIPIQTTKSLSPVVPQQSLYQFLWIYKRCDKNLQLTLCQQAIEGAENILTERKEIDGKPMFVLKK